MNTPRSPIERLVTPAARWLAQACGWVLFAYATALTAEILGRKLFNSSFRGIDELGGFTLAVTAAVGASYALAVRSHTRVDVFLTRMPRTWRRVLNALAMVCFAAFALFAAWRSTAVLLETIELGSSATNLGQPLWIPQLIWVVGLWMFACIALTYAVHAVYLFARGRPELNAWYGPLSAQDELDAELIEIKSRSEKAED